MAAKQNRGGLEYQQCHFGMLHRLINQAGIAAAVNMAHRIAGIQKKKRLKGQHPKGLHNQETAIEATENTSDPESGKEE